MANDLTDILPKILARGLLALREQAIMPRLVNGDFSAEAAQKGSTIDVPIPSAVGIQQVAPGVTPIPAVDTAAKTVPVQLNNWYQNDPIHLTDKDLVDIDRNRHFIPMQMSEAIRDTVNVISEKMSNHTSKLFDKSDSQGKKLVGLEARFTGHEQLCEQRDRSIHEKISSEFKALKHVLNAEKKAKSESKGDRRYLITTIVTVVITIVGWLIAVL